MTEQTRPRPEIQKGDYVLATRWRDGDPKDPWAVGFYDGSDGADKFPRHYVLNNAGIRIRHKGFARIKKISAKRGAWLLENSNDLELSGRSLYGALRMPMREAQP